MATLKHAPSRRPTLAQGRVSRGKLWRGVLWGLLLAVAVWLGASWSHLHQLSRVAASVGAKVGCSCHYIEGRPLGECPSDFETGMGPVWLSDDAATHTITARYAIIATERATWHAGQGCLLEPWKN